MKSERIQCELLESKIKTAKEAAMLIKDGMNVAFGGQVSTGAPKVIPVELAKRKKNGECLRINVFSTSNNNFIDETLSTAGLINKRFPMSDSKCFASLANKNEVCYVEQQMNRVKSIISSNRMGEIDYLIIEALCVLKDGSIVPTTSIGNEPFYLSKAKKLIIEINEKQPIELIGVHDVFEPTSNSPIPLLSIDSRIGNNYMKIDLSKIDAIVITNEEEKEPTFPDINVMQDRLVDNLIKFLKQEKQRMKWKKIPPIQTGFGNLANAVVKKLADSDVGDISFFCGHLQSSNMEYLINNKESYATCSSVQFDSKSLEDFIINKNGVRDRIVLRNSDLINNSEIISRMHPIALTTGIEIDIYGNANISHISGSKVVNGIGGGANFAENAGLSIFMIVSEGKNGNISTIVPMVTHQDISEHDIDVVITENGIADLRGLSDIERANAIINNCSCGYKNQLSDYFTRAIKEGGHHPVLLEEAFSWHISLKTNGTMKKEVQ